MAMEVKADALMKADCPMLVNLEPVSNITEVNFDAAANEYCPMVVTFAGMVMEAKLDAP